MTTETEQLWTPKRGAQLGMKFGRLYVLGLAEHRRLPSGQWSAYWLCERAGRNRKAVYHSSLTRGKVKSCGCLCQEISAWQNRTHGMTGTRLYRIWRNIHTRCENKNSADFARYGGGAEYQSARMV